MTYDRAIKGSHVAREVLAAVSHGLTSSPRWGEGKGAPGSKACSTRNAMTIAMGARLSPFSPWGEGARRADEGAFNATRAALVRFMATCACFARMGT